MIMILLDMKAFAAVWLYFCLYLYDAILNANENIHEGGGLYSSSSNTYAYV